MRLFEVPAPLRNGVARDVVRCEPATITTVVDSPVPGIRQVFQRALCLCTWRSAEPHRRTRREAYPAGFRMTAKNIAAAVEAPPVPPLAVRRTSPRAGRFFRTGTASGAEDAVATRAARRLPASWVPVPFDGTSRGQTVSGPFRA
ncbi:non-oxidative hydroxyarylic acid decarboxylases subunit D [Streptomyces sclerotialus]|uniref:non-oxidative hydroxyarylic acid decarboxylases subunit D n=1 Tax=Streptomyces sclerotialus TaxID=1957 RepID=UPI0034A18FF9